MRELLLLKIYGQQYGVWKDQVVSVRDVKTLHRLPLSPACIAGMSIIDDRTVTLADLPVCMGYPSQEGDGTGRILMLPGPEKIAGFMVSGDIDSISLADDAEFPMPEYLKTDVIDSCAVKNAVPIPVINVLRLSSQLLKTDHELPRASFTIPHAHSPEKSLSTVRILELGGDLYAAASAGMEEQPIPPGQLAQLALVPQFVKGIMFYNGTVMPVIDLSQRIKRQKSSGGACAIVSDISGLKFALVADKDLGTLPPEDTVISDLPPIARTRSISAAVLKAEEIIPLVDLGALLSLNGKDPGEKPLDHRYAPDSDFGSLFRKQDVDLVEFSLLGSRHAVPKSEVEDIIPIKSYRQIPDTPEIVIGVAEHKGSLLPVLDLAMVFGRRSLATTEWRMMLVKNGDFRALVITDAVFVQRPLPLDIQRAVPIQLPHRVVYGCYPDAQTVRLILNVEALAVYFEKSLVQELLPALSDEMKQAPAEVVPSLLGEEAKETSEYARHESFESESGTVDREPQSLEPATVLTEGRESVGRKTETAFETTQEEKQPRQEGIVQEAGERETVTPLARTEEKQESISPIAATALPPVSETESARESREAETRAVVNSVGVSDLKEAVAVVEDTAPIETSAEVPKEAVDEDMPPLARNGSAPGRAVAEDAVPVETGQEEMVEEFPAADEPAKKTRIEETPVVAVEEPAAETPFLGRRNETAAAPQHQPEIASRGVSSEFSTSRLKRLIGIGAIMAVLIALLFVLSMFVKTDREEHAKEIISAKIVPVKTEPQTVPVVQKPMPSLELDVPAHRAVNIDVYVVIKDDTLWSISERFTGNPFNYPRIAGENRIADPDLIFPGQKIRLVKK